MVGEGWSVIMGGGPAFADVQNPRVMVQCGARGEEGKGGLEITDVVFTTRGPGEWLVLVRGERERMNVCVDWFALCLAPGAIVVEWNVNSPVQGGAGMWDTHIRLGGCTSLLCPSVLYRYCLRWLT